MERGFLEHHRSNVACSLQGFGSGDDIQSNIAMEIVKPYLSEYRGFKNECRFSERRKVVAI